MNLFQSAHSVKKFLRKHNFLSISYPPYSPDLVLSGLYTMPEQKSIEKGNRFMEVPEIV
jgi:hypothetical protein